MTKDLPTRIYKEFLQIRERNNNSIRRQVKDLDRHFTKEDMQMAIKRVTIPSISENVEQLELSRILSSNVK